MISNRHSTTFHYQGSVQYNEVLKKFYEKIYGFNRYKIENFEKSFECYSSFSYLTLILDKSQYNSLINWSTTRSLIAVISGVIKAYAENFKFLFRIDINDSVLDPPNSHTKIMYEKLNQATRKIMLCSYSIRILYYLIKNSSELKMRFIDLNGFEDLIMLLENDMYVSNHIKHRSLDSTMMCLSFMSADRSIRLPSRNYGDILLKMNSGDDKTAFVRCKIIYNLYEGSELLTIFEEKILQRTIFVARILKKNSNTQLKAEFNSIFFLYSILSLFRDRQKLIKAILDENILHIFINQINNLSILFSKFNQFNYVFVELNSLQIPSYDQNDQNRNNVCRIVYYVSVFYQLLVSNLDHYRKQKLSLKKTLSKSICNILSNQQFLTKFSKKYFKTVIELEKCLFFIYTHDIETTNELHLSIFDILFNAATNSENCSKESFLILTQIINVDRMNKITDRFARIIESCTNQISEVYNKVELRNYLCLLYFILKNPKRFEIEKTNLIKTTLRLQDTMLDLIHFGLQSDKFNFGNRFDYEKSLFDNKCEVNVSIFFYLFNLTCFFMENVNFKEHQIQKVGKFFNAFQLVLANKNFANQMFYVDLVIKSTNIMVSILKFDNFREEIFTTPKNTTDLIKLMFFFANTDEAKSDKNDRREIFLKTTVIENLIFILRKYINYDVNLINFYAQSIENCINDIKTENLKDNLKKIYHFKEKESFSVYCKSNSILTYNLMILTEFARNDSHIKHDELRLGQLLKEIILNQNSISQIEKKYVFQLFFQLLLLNKIPENVMHGDKELVNKIVEIKNANNLNDTVDDDNKLEIKWLNKTSEESASFNKWSINKYLANTCQEILWILDFSQKKEELKHQNKITLLYDHSNQDLCTKLKIELEKNYIDVVMDIYDEGRFDLPSLADSIRTTAVLVLVFSESYKHSIYFQMQFKCAILAEKKIIPILIDDSYHLEKYLNLSNHNMNILYFNTNNDKFEDFLNALLSEIDDYKINNNSFFKRVPSAFVTECEEKVLAKLSLLGNKSESDLSNYENVESLNSSSRGCELNYSYSVNEENKTGDAEIQTFDMIDIDEDQPLNEIENQLSITQNDRQIKSAKSFKLNSSKSFKLNSALRSSLPSKWNKKQVKMWFELNNINLNIFKCLGNCDGELLFTYHQILTVEPKFFFEEILKKRNVANNETFDADDITVFRLKLKSLFG